MPGYLIHLSFGNEILKTTEKIEDSIAFLQGNLVPDLAMDKTKSHFYIQTENPLFVCPDLNRAKEVLKDKNNPLLLGVYAHLYLDYYYVQKILIDQFEYDFTSKTVTSKSNGKNWPFDVFFSDQGMYKAYSEINPLLISDGRIDRKKLEEIGQKLPLTNISFFDQRNSESWKSQINRYLKDSPKYTGDIFEYSFLCDFIDKTAKKFVEEIIL